MWLFNSVLATPDTLLIRHLCLYTGNLGNMADDRPVGGQILGSYSVIHLVKLTGSRWATCYSSHLGGDGTVSWVT